MKLPEPVLPLLQQVAASRRMPLEFWNHDDGYRIMDCFFELASALAHSQPNLDGLPQGYRLAGVLFRWEAECQAEGWNAFEWIKDVNAVTEAYAAVGLANEGRAVAAAAAAWAEAAGDRESHEAASKAYDEASPDRRIESDRLEYLVCHFCEHANELFYEPQTA